ncbi:Biotin--protein ligase 1, chloroplastic-like protein [Drosera capensis]
MLFTSPPRLLPVLLHRIAAASPPPMTSSPSSLFFVLAAKSKAEIELAKQLKDTDALTLTEDNDDEEEIAVKLYSEMREEEKVVSSFDVGKYMSSNGTDRFGRFLVWSPGLGSTQDVVSKNFGVIPVGSVCVADVQFKGRGRPKNVWDSCKGCLMFSFTIQMEDGRMVPLVQYKTHRAPSRIGVNLDNRYPTTCLNAALQELISTSCLLRREDIMCSFFNKFEKYFDLFSVQGFQPLEDLYCKAWLHSQRDHFVSVAQLVQVQFCNF